MTAQHRQALAPLGMRQLLQPTYCCTDRVRENFDETSDRADAPLKLARLAGHMLQNLELETSCADCADMVSNQRAPQSAHLPESAGLHSPESRGDVCSLQLAIVMGP